MNEITGHPKQVSAAHGAAVPHQTINLQTEAAYWRENYLNRPGAVKGYTYEQDYAVAYQVGYTGRSRHQGTYAEHEKDLGVEWERVKGESRLTWDQAEAAIRAAWDHAEQQLPPGSTGHGIRNDVMDGVVGADMVEIADPAAREQGYWREHFATRPGYVSGYTYEDDYAAAYRIGYEGRNFYKTTFEDNEDDLKADWERLKGASRLTWEQAKTAMQEAWAHIEAEMPVNADP